MRYFAAIAALTLTTLGQSQVFGPINTRNQRALSLPFLRLSPIWGALSENEQESRVSFYAANDSRFRNGGAVEEDKKRTAWFGIIEKVQNRGLSEFKFLFSIAMAAF